MSDLHGCLTQFRQLLDLVSPCDDDAVWVLGDVCDRGDETAETLAWCVEEAPPNMRFLLGNHDLYAREVFGRPPEMWHTACDRGGWWFNGGTDTLYALEEMRDEEWVVSRLEPWLKGLVPYSHVVDGNGREWMLTHAGFDTRKWDADGLYPDTGGEGNVLDVGHGFGSQDEFVMVWVRRGWYDYEGETPLPVVYGHSPVPYLAKEASELRRFYGSSEGRWLDSVPSDCRIWHYKDRHDIDCGCVYGGRLAMLRLEDGEEFYVDGPGLE